MSSVNAQPETADFEGWRLSRVMREAETDAQVNFAEQKYNDWRQIN